jgi:hypothetical protein
MNGHKFIQRQFYQPIMCALCQEFLLTGDGYQCADCRYACHRKCYPKVVTKCISKSNADAVSPAVRPEVAMLTGLDSGRGRGEDQPPHPASLRRVHQHVCELVLPLRLYDVVWPQELGQVFRWVDSVPR